MNAESPHNSARDANSVSRFNIFQRLVRQWDQIHPYNGAQILKITGPADLSLIRNSWHESLTSLGLGQVCIADNGYTHLPLNGQADTHTVQQLPEGTDLAAWISSQLNLPFGATDNVPFRPFVIEESDSHWMGLVYQHWVADSVSIRLLLREWFVRCHDPSAISPRPVRLAKDGYWRTFGPARAGWKLFSGIASSARWAHHCRRARRIERRPPPDPSVRFSLYQVQDGMIDALRVAAKSRQVTINDLFLAAMAQTCDVLAPARPSRRHPNLALGTIVDLRPSVDQDMSDVFGLFLGFTSIICRPQQLQNIDELIQTIARQTARQRQRGAGLASILRMSLALLAGRFYSPEQMINFYRKRVPLTGGISNVNLNQTWAAQYHPGPLLDYVRASPAGPIMPIAFTITTLGNHLSLGLTCRAAIIDEDRSSSIATMFLDRLRILADLPERKTSQFPTSTPVLTAQR